MIWGETLALTGFVAFAVFALCEAVWGYSWREIWDGLRAFVLFVLWRSTKETDDA